MWDERRDEVIKKGFSNYDLRKCLKQLISDTASKENSSNENVFDVLCYRKIMCWNSVLQM